MGPFTPPGGNIKNWYVRVQVPSDRKGHFGKAAEFRRSTKTTDKVVAMALAAVFTTEQVRAFMQKRAEIAAMRGQRLLPNVVLDPKFIRNITSIRLAIRH